jgi:CheY-like chemotaxis protein
LKADSSGVRVCVDPGSIEQVVMNLAVNARDAMPNGGKLTIETTTELVGGGFAPDHHTGIKPGRYGVLSVTDTGTGMDAATQAQIFEPFFTTKEVGKGTGLGLSTVFGIVEQSSGALRVRSGLGNGTTVSVYLPQVDAELDRLTSLSTAPSRGTETILVVEDEEQVRIVACAILKRSGYRVIEMRSASEAQQFCHSHLQPIDLLLTDVVMPEMSGPVLARSLIEDRPSLRVLCMSGYFDDNTTHHNILHTDFALLQKPFTSDSLTRKVRELLDVGAAS